MILSLLIALAVVAISQRGITQSDSLLGSEYSNQFAVHIPSGARVAEDVASTYGIRNRGKIGNLDNIFFFEVTVSEEGSTRGKDIPFQNLTSLNLFQCLSQERRVVSVQCQKLLRRAKRYSPPTDPRWTRQWSLRNTGQVGGSPGHDLNVEPAWIQGLTGKGVVVAVVDDGVLHQHPDLIANFDDNGSYDFVDNDVDVAPGYSHGERDSHGTSCAGEIAMAKDNEICGVGVAYEAKIAGLRLISQFTTDAAEASALGYKMDYIDIYSNSWGPFDNGILVEGPGPLLKAVMMKGVEKGRGGKGSIYVWAAGNGGHKDDSCATDGYASSVYTIAVGVADQYGTQAYYDETCTSKMAVTFSHNTETLRRNQVITTSVNGTCRDDFMGTSAACPLVSGAIALVLQANPTLTWRDVQYLIAYTSKYLPLRHRSYWNRNGAGLWVSQKFGFGAINAEALVSRARNWINVPEVKSFTFQPLPGPRNATHGKSLVINFNVGKSNTTIRHLEHVIVEVSLSLAGYRYRHSYLDYLSISTYMGVYYTEEDLDNLLNHNDARRGDISITLVSPQGTRSDLLPHRDRDFVNSEGFDSWPFMSVLHWGEDPQGQWTLTVSYRSHSGYVHLSKVNITFYGTESAPEAVRMIPAQCDSMCQGGCATEGPHFCDSCKSYRNATTLECVDRCMEGSEVHNRYCIDSLVSTNYSYTPPKFPPSIYGNAKNTSMLLGRPQSPSATATQTRTSFSSQKTAGLYPASTMPIHVSSTGSPSFHLLDSSWLPYTHQPRPTTSPYPSTSVSQSQHSGSLSVYFRTCAFIFSWSGLLCVFIVHILFF